METLSLKMKTIWHPWNEWECYEAGMYDGKSDRSSDECKALYAEFLADVARFRVAMDRVVSEWPKSCEHFLSKRGFNRIAWLGQAAMCIDTGVSRRHRAGYMLLDPEQQRRANKAAEDVLNEWQKNQSVCFNVAAAGLRVGYTGHRTGRSDGGLFGPFIQGDLFRYPQQ